jgi:phage FluMu protein Com
MPQQVKCPVCKQRLFDLKIKTTGSIDIKCQKCKKVITIEMNDRIVTKINQY